MSLGDVIALQGQRFPEYTQDITEGVHSRLPLICYKVIKILPPRAGFTSYLVNSLHASVFQVCNYNFVHSIYDYSVLQVNHYIATKMMVHP